MRRAVKHILIFGLLACGGVVMSYLVAWGLTLKNHRTSEQVGVRPWDDPPGYWTVQVHRCAAFECVFSSWTSPDILSRGMGEKPEDLLPAWSGWSTIPERAQQFRGETARRQCYAAATMCAFGWPFRSTCWRRFDELGSAGSTHEVSEFAGAVTIPIATAGLQPNFVEKGIRLPLALIWPGLAFNTAFYGGILWILCFGPGIVRRGCRRRRGQCVKCGYDLRGSSSGGGGGGGSAGAGGGGGAVPECGGGGCGEDCAVPRAGGNRFLGASPDRLWYAVPPEENES